MSSETRDDPKTVTGSINRGLHPENMPTDKLRQYMPGDLDAEDAQQVHNPHEWDDPERSWKERLIPSTVARQILAAAIGVLLLGLLLHFYPLVGAFFGSLFTLGGAALLASHLIVWLHGNQRGMDRYKDLDKWVRFEGDDADVAAVERLDEENDDGVPLFNAIKRLSYGGFNKTLLPRRDLPYDTSTLKRYPDDDGLEPVTDAGNAWTYKADTDTLGTFYVTDTAGLDWAKGMDGAERYATPPEKLDQEKWDEAARLINELQKRIQHLNDDLDMALEHAEGASDLRDELQLPQLEAAIQNLERVAEIGQPYQGSRGQRSQQTEDQVPVQAPVRPSMQHSYDETETGESE